MYMYTQGHSCLISTGVYIPPEQVTSKELMQEIDSKNRFNISYDWLETATGISERRITPAGISPSDMAVSAATEALDRAKISASQIDVIIYAGVVRDYLVEPGTAHAIQGKLNALNATVLDVNNACNGFMTGIYVMDALIATGQARYGLIVTGEKNRPYLERAVDALKKTSGKESFMSLAAGLTLGDAGAAMIIGPKLDPETGFMGFMNQSQGQHAKHCTCGENFSEGPLHTNMRKIIGESAKLIAPMHHALFNKLQWKTEELSKYFIHQVSILSFKLHRKILSIPRDMMPNTVSTLGNITTATIPVNIYNFSKSPEAVIGKKVYLSGVGSGISLSQAGLIWNAA